MIRKRRRYFAAHPEADLNETMEKMKRGLLAYGQGKTDVATALKKEGLSAPRAGTHTMYVMSYIGQQAALLEEQGNQTKYSFQGIDEETGRKIYRADFGEGLEKREKQKKLVQLIQDVWAKKPITLTLNDEGTERKITAKFDPDYDEAGKRPTDAGKMAYGNKMGSSKERRITLELSGDMHQIISDAAYLTSEKERGKQTPTHQDVKKWDYFATDIIVEKAEEGKAPYTVFVDVKEKETGNYVYTFYALNEKKSAKLRSLATAAPSIIQGVTTTKPVEAADGEMDFTGTSVKENSIVDTSIYEGSENVNGKFSLSSEVEEQDGRTQLPDFDAGVSVKKKYMEQTDTRQFKRWFRGSEAVNADGTPKIFYYGTPNGTFNTFRNWQYFTENKAYADGYQNQGASSNGYKKTAENKKTYAVYLQTGKMRCRGRGYRRSSSQCRQFPSASG